MPVSKSGQTALLPLAASPSAQPLTARSTPRNAVFLGSLDTKQPYSSLKEISGVLLVALAVFALCVLSIGRPFLPNEGPMWGLCLLWFCSHIGGWVATKCQLPSCIGMVLAGFMLQNIGTHPIQGLPVAWMARLQVAGFAFTMTHTSAACSNPMEQFRQHPWAAYSLAWLPLLLETGMAALLFGVLFSMPVLLALAGGFAVGATSPEAIMAGLIRLARKGYGVSSGISQLAGAASGLAMCTAGAFFAMFAGLAIPHGRTALDSAQLPLSPALGLAGACAGAILSASTLLWRTALQRAFALALTCQALVFLGHHFEFIGAGVIAVWVCAALTVSLWSTAQPRLLSQPGPDEGQKIAGVDAIIGSVWAVMMQPLLFGCAGASVSAANMPDNSLAKALLLVFSGLAVRIPVALLSLLRGPFSWRESIFLALSWVAKAAHQAAFGAIPLSMVLQHKAASDVDYPQYAAWGRQIAGVCLLDILVAGSMSALIMRFLGPRCLDQDAEAVSRTQAFGGDLRGGSQQSETHSPLPQPRRPAPSAPLLDTPVQRSHSASSASGNPFLEVELSTPKHPHAAKVPAPRQRSLGRKEAPEHVRAASPRGIESGPAPPPDSYAAMMSPLEAPIGAGKAGNPFVALGHAGRALAAKLNAYKPLRIPSGVPGLGLAAEADPMLRPSHDNPLYASRSVSVEVELLASPRESRSPRIPGRAAAHGQEDSLVADRASARIPSAVLNPLWVQESRVEDTAHRRPAVEFITQASNNLTRFPPGLELPEDLQSAAYPSALAAVPHLHSLNPFADEADQYERAASPRSAAPQALEFTVNPHFELQEVDDADADGLRLPQWASPPPPPLHQPQPPTPRRSSLSQPRSATPHSDAPDSPQSGLERRRSVRFSVPEGADEGLPPPLRASSSAESSAFDATFAGEAPHTPFSDQAPTAAPQTSPRAAQPRGSGTFGKAPAAHAEASTIQHAHSGVGLPPKRWSRQSSGVGLTRFGRSDADRTWAALQGASQLLQQQGDDIKARFDSEAGGKYLLSPQSSQDALPSPTALRDLRDVWGSSTPPLTDSAGTPPRRSSSAHNWPGVDMDPEALILPSRSPRIQIPSADASTARTPDTIDTGASTPRSRLGQPPLEQPPPELGADLPTSPMRRLKSRTSWEEAKQAVKRATFDVDSRRGLLPPEIERAKHAMDDVDTPAVSPRAGSPRAGSPHAGSSRGAFASSQRSFEDVTV